MTKPGYTHVSLVVDRSGSMQNMAAESTNGINILIKDQFQETGQFTVTLTQFDSAFETVCRLSNQAPSYVLEPRGSTALLDAVGNEITATGEDLAKMAEHDRPERVIFVIVTDGQENASSNYTLEQVRSLIKDQTEKYDWDFQFLGVNDAAWQGADLGMKFASFEGTGKGSSASYKRLNHEMKRVRNSRDMSQKLEVPDFIPESDDDNF
ncbi:MAG: hypothetical protein RLZZ330_484 [Actinomycetota bacterium]